MVLLCLLPMSMLLQILVNIQLYSYHWNPMLLRSTFHSRAGMVGSSQSHSQSRSRTGTSSARRGSQRGRGGTSRGGRGSSSQQGMDQSVGRANWDHGPRGGAAGPEVAMRGGYQPVTNSHTSFGYGRQYSKSTHYQEFMNKSSLYPSYEP